MRVLIAGGGTGGHLTPSLATAEELRRVDEHGRVLIVGRKGGVAERLVAAAGLELQQLDVSGLDWTSPWSVARFCFSLPQSAWAARQLLRRFGAECVVGAGGYVSAPVVVAARQLGLPIVLLEQNAVPGRATRWLSRGATVVAASFAVTARHLPGRRVVFTGNPVRSRIVSLAAEAQPRRRLQNLLVTGGSQGARTINTAVADAAGRLLSAYPDMQITHQCGRLDLTTMLQRRSILPPEQQERYRVDAFFDDMAAEMARADLVLMRAGASSLAEAAALALPMILVPYPHAGNHQRWNAEVFANAGAAGVIPDSEFNSQSALDAIAEIAGGEKMNAMSQASQSLGKPQAATAVVELIRDALASRRAA